MKMIEFSMYVYPLINFEFIACNALLIQKGKFNFFNVSIYCFLMVAYSGFVSLSFLRRMLDISICSVVNKTYQK